MFIVSRMTFGSELRSSENGTSGNAEMSCIDRKNYDDVKYEPRLMEKTNVVSEQVRLKPACTVTEKR